MSNRICLKQIFNYILVTNEDEFGASKFSKNNLNYKFKPSTVTNFIKGNVNNAKTISPKLGGASLLLTGLDAYVNGNNFTTGQWTNFGLSAALTAGAMVMPALAPFAFGYGVAQLGSWVISGRSVEENIELMITKP
jgi:hypothetical protein